MVNLWRNYGQLVSGWGRGGVMWRLPIKDQLSVVQIFRLSRASLHELFGFEHGPHGTRFELFENEKETQ